MKTSPINAAQLSASYRSPQTLQHVSTIMSLSLPHSAEVKQQLINIHSASSSFSLIKLYFSSVQSCQRFCVRLWTGAEPLKRWVLLCPRLQQSIAAQLVHINWTTLRHLTVFLLLWHLTVFVWNSECCLRSCRLYWTSRLYFKADNSFHCQIIFKPAETLS